MPSYLVQGCRYIYTLYTYFYFDRAVNSGDWVKINPNKTSLSLSRYVRHHYDRFLYGVKTAKLSLDIILVF